MTIVMNTHSVCFTGENKQIINGFGLKKEVLSELWISDLSWSKNVGSFFHTHFSSLCLLRKTRDTIFNLITAYTPISAQSRNSVSSDYNLCTFSLLLYKGICCEYSFELHWLVDAIQMSTHNICLYKENQKKKKKSHIHHQTVLFWSFYSVSLVG